MALALDTKILFRLASNLTSGLDLSSASNPLNFLKNLNLATGTAKDQADLIFHDQRTLAASATEDLDLAGSLLDVYGNTITFLKIKAMAFFGAAANTNDVEISQPAANGFTNWCLAASDGIVVGPGGLFFLFRPDLAGYAVTGGTGDLLTITNGAGGSSVTYDVILIGTSA